MFMYASTITVTFVAPTTDAAGVGGGADDDEVAAAVNAAVSAGCNAILTENP